ncbi:MAG: type II toxin-antitoxin system HigB family toxin [Prevotella sp.]|nr:type II toxin-antitoxin system HigB family toxin [Prevotella sp.]
MFGKTDIIAYLCTKYTRQLVGHQHYVFNIKGNDYRMVVVIKFTINHVLIRFIGTHEEYDKIKDIQNI